MPVTVAHEKVLTLEARQDHGEDARPAPRNTAGRGHRRGDDGGHALLVHRIDGTQYSSVATAMGKGGWGAGPRSPTSADPHPEEMVNKGAFVLSAGRRPGGFRAAPRRDRRSAGGAIGSRGSKRRRRDRRQAGSTPPAGPRLNVRVGRARSGGTPPDSGMGTPRPRPSRPSFRLKEGRFTVPATSRPSTTGSRPGAAHPGLRMVEPASAMQRPRSVPAESSRTAPVRRSGRREGHLRTRGIPTRLGSRIFANQCRGAPPGSCAARGAGGLVRASRDDGVRLPPARQDTDQWNNAHTPGGSSKRRGGRVATGFVRSHRHADSGLGDPAAAFCGIVGSAELRAISRDGVFPFSKTWTTWASSRVPWRDAPVRRCPHGADLRDEAPHPCRLVRSLAVPLAPLGHAPGWRW